MPVKPTPETGCHYLDSYEIVDDAGARHLLSDPCRFLVKDLGPAGRS